MAPQVIVERFLVSPADKIDHAGRALRQLPGLKTLELSRFARPALPSSEGLE